MKQARKHRRALALVPALVSLAALALLMPAGAAAQSAAAGEYSLGPLPTPKENPQATTSSASDEPSETPSSPGSTTSVPVIPADDSSASSSTSDTSTGGKSDSGEGDRESKASGDKAGDSEGGPSLDPADVVPAVQTGASDGGGAPISLIVLGVIAAICTAAAAWRMRGREDEPAAGGSDAK